MDNISNHQTETFSSKKHVNKVYNIEVNHE